MSLRDVCMYACVCFLYLRDVRKVHLDGVLVLVHALPQSLKQRALQKLAPHRVVHLHGSVAF